MATVAFDVYAELLGLDSVLTLETMLLLGDIANNDGSWAEAERLGKEALAISSRKFGENSPMATDCKLVLAQAYGHQGYLTKAGARTRESRHDRQHVERSQDIREPEETSTTKLYR